VIAVQRIERIKISGCINVGAFTIVEDTSEDSTVRRIIDELVEERVGRASDCMSVMVLQVFS